MKICSWCRVEKPAEDFAKCRAAADGRQYYCRACVPAYRKSRRDRKRCDKCGISRPRDQYYESRITADGLFGTCATCCRVGSGEWSKAGRRAQYAEEYMSTRDE